MKHKHAEVIKAWADGAQIQWRDTKIPAFKEWQDFDSRQFGCHPSWHLEYEYRVKPEKKSAAQVYWDAAHPESTGAIPPDWVQLGAKAVIEAYKRGEIEDV